MKELPNAKAVYEIYAVLFSQPFSIQRKSVIFSALLAGEPWSWQVIGISRAALEALSEKDFRYVGGAICRAHIVDRISTANAIFCIAAPLAQRQLFSLLIENGRTIITTKSENKSAPRLPSFIPIESTRGLFRNKLISFTYGRDERNALRELYVDLNNGKISLVRHSDNGLAHN